MAGNENHSMTRSEIHTEINALARRQIKSLKDATFIGWDPDELVAYEERSIRLTWFRKQLAELNAASSRPPPKNSILGLQ